MNEMTLFSDVESEKKSGLTEITTRELAEVLGVEKRTIQETANRLLSANVLSHLETKSVVGGKTFVFDEEQATLIKKEIQKHHNLASRQIDNVSTDTEMMMNIQRDFAWLVQKNKELQAKADFYDCVTGSKDTVDMKECAKVINFQGWGRNKIFELLRQKGVLDRENQPYQRYCDMKYFRIIESKYILPTGEVKISLKTVVYQRGLDFIRKLIEKEENEHKKPLKMLAE